MKRFEHNALTAFFLLPSCFTKIVPAIFVNVNVNVTVIDGCAKIDRKLTRTLSL